jgi:tetratricopeptide (TPR) repeat protein
MYLASIDGNRGDYGQALSRFKESLHIFQDCNDVSSYVAALYNIGVTLVYLENYEEAQPVLEQSLQVWRSLEDNLGVCMALKNLAHVMRQRGDLRQAKTAIDESMEHLLESGAHSFRGETLLEMGFIEEALGNYRTSLGHFHDALRHTVEIRDEPGIWEAIEGVGLVSVALKRAEADNDGYIDSSEETSKSSEAFSTQFIQTLEFATQILAASDKQYRRNKPPSHEHAGRFNACIQWLCAALGEDEFGARWVAGQRLTWETASRLALSDPLLGFD